MEANALTDVSSDQLLPGLLYAKQKYLGCKKARPIRSSSYLAIHVTKSFDIS